METEFILPDLEGEDTAAFWAGCARGELLVQACGHCGRWRFPPRPMCPHCRSIEQTWEPVSGQGHDLVLRRPAPAAAARLRRRSRRTT